MDFIDGGPRYRLDAVEATATQGAAGWTVSAGAAQTRRAPTSYELYADGVHAATAAYEKGDPAQRLERGQQLDLGLAWAEGGRSARLNLFASRFANYIALAGALAHFGHGVEAIACPSIDEVFRATEAGNADFGVVPVENSTEGAVNRSLDLMLQTPLSVLGETAVDVRHTLMNRDGDRGSIRKVCAHPQALGRLVLARKRLEEIEEDARQLIGG